MVQITQETLTGSINVADYGAAGDGISDDTVALQNAINTGKPISLTYGAEYVITAPLLSYTGTVIHGNGATIVTEGDFDTTAAIDINLPLKRDGEPVTSLINTSSGSMPSTIAASGTEVTRISVADVPGFKRGGVVKVYSSDKIPQSDPTHNECIGEFATIAYVDVSGGHVYLDRVLYHSGAYVTSPRISALNDEGVLIERLTFKKPDNQPATANTKGIRVRNAISPVVENITFVDCDDDGLTYIGCFSARSRNITGRGLKTDAANSSTGYLVLDVSSSYGIHTNIQGNALRKAYDSDVKGTGTPETDKQMWFGEGAGNMVCDSTAIAFGCHAGTRDLVFSNCHVEATTFRTPDTATTRGYMLRGVNTRVTGSFVKAGGVNVITESGATQSASAEWHGAGIDAHPVHTDDGSIRTAITLTGIDGFPAKLRVYGGVVSGLYSASVNIDYGEIETHNTHFKHRRNADSIYETHIFTLKNKSSVRNFNPTYDTEGHLGTGALRLAKIDSDDASFTSYDGNWVGIGGLSVGAVNLCHLKSKSGTVKVFGLRTDEVVNPSFVSANGATVEHVEYQIKI